MNDAEGPFFLDSNILIYAFDTQDPAKRARSRSLIESLPADSIVLSAQVVNEFYFTVTRKLRRPLSAADAEEAVRGLSGFRILPLDHRLTLAAMGLVRTHQLSIWDALILQSAIEGKCRTLFSEDFQNGRKYGTLRVVNPFAL
ncbi:MAG: PIN domain-containing protein [Vicinamibacteria bacterium]